MIPRTMQDVAHVFGFQNPLATPGLDRSARMLNYILDNVIQSLVESIWYKKLTLFFRRDNPRPGEMFHPGLEYKDQVLEEW